MRTVQELREHHCLSQRELALLTRVTVGPGRGRRLSRHTIYAVERGDHRPRPSTKRAIAAALGVSPHEIAWPTGVPAEEAAS